jgi:hypothetical protein
MAQWDDTLHRVTAGGTQVAAYLTTRVPTLARLAGG